MPAITKLSEIISEIDEHIRDKFDKKTFWITAELGGVKKKPLNHRCFFDFVEKNENEEYIMKGVIFKRGYEYIELFESTTGKEFISGIEITCKVRVSLYKAKTQPQLEVIEIDFAHTTGQLELEKHKTLSRLIRENRTIKLLQNGKYKTKNNSLNLPIVIQRIALITASNSDGQRDFKNVIRGNKYSYDFYIKEYLTTIQGNFASSNILEKLKLIKKDNYDVVVIVRGGGSDTDFSVFNDYDLAKAVATFPIPILTGIGHDRNKSIVDLLATKECRTPTEVALKIIDQNMEFESKIQQLRRRIFQRTEILIESRKTSLLHYKQRVKNLNPETILQKGFAIIKYNGNIVTDPKEIEVDTEIQTILKDEIINSTINKKMKNENNNDI